MEYYSSKMEVQMQRFYESLNERDRRRYSAIEAGKLGHGAMSYISQLLGCDPKTIANGMEELESEQALDNQRQRKKGVDAKEPRRSQL
jgi:hypothetical protein